MKNTGMVLSLTMTWMLVGCVPGMTSNRIATANTKTDAATRVSVEPAAPAPARVVKARKPGEAKYLAAIHKMIQPRWQQVLVNAQALLPSSHPANDPGRVTEIEVHLDNNGQLKRIRIRRSSGNNPFDNSALATMTRISKYPALPAQLQNGHLELRWRFHRDTRACQPTHVGVVLHPLTPEEAFSRALSRKQWESARQILQQNPGRQTLKSILAEAGLSSKDSRLNMLALRVAPRQRLLALLENETSMKRWKSALDVLASRKGQSEIIAHLKWVARPVSRLNGSAKTSLEAKKIAAVLAVLTRMGVKAPAALVNGLMSRKDAAVVMAAAPMATDAAALSVALRTFINDPKLAGPLAVYRLALGPDTFAQTIAVKALSSKDSMATLRALQQVPVRSMATHLEPMVRDNRTAVALRLEAIKALSKIADAPAPFYSALSAPDTRVKVEAIRALGQFKQNTTGICYRLSTIGMKNRNKIGAEALAAVARIGSGQFLPAMAYMTSRQRPADKALVVASYWGFGKAAVPLLNKMAGSSDPRVREAARKSLDRISGKAPTPDAPGVVTSPLGQLMQHALTLAAAPATQKGSKKGSEPALAKSDVDTGATKR